MSENVRPFIWNEERLQAAQLLAEGVLTSEQIARKAKITARQLQRWKAHPEFGAKVAELVKVLEAVVLDQGIARRVNRVKALNDRWDRMQSVIKARAAESTLRDVAGGKSGLIVRTSVRVVGSGDEAEVVDIFAVDTGLLKELREHEKQAAKELGQWVEKVAPTDPNGDEEYGAGFTPTDRATLVESLLARLGISPAEPSGVGQADADGQAAGESEPDHAPGGNAS